MLTFTLSSTAQAALDHPVWSSLTGGHRHFALGGPLAKRYPREIGPFAALAEDSPGAWNALGALIGPEEAVMLVTPEAVRVAPGFTFTGLSPVLQMVATRDTGASSADPLLLGDADAEQMRALTALTNPGPFGSRTHELGEFLGFREGGALAAMTGERMRLPGLVEVSAVCVHPGHRGKAYARILMVEKMRRIVDRGDVPFLHVYPHNHGAIALYASLGYVVRRQLHLTRVRLAE
ncbi:GNAT family N-acetyltransferase [Massilia niastensis]|uniref:GNAT family N-acetyltransferase n=1 Tax=Massilia niastensis TaxID=544911 RepID=UPI000375FF88|nr:GNAT family N-acetyltransferase [Massilia niastensis]